MILPLKWHEISIEKSIQYYNLYMIITHLYILLLTFDLRSRALCNCAASEPWSGPSELDDRDMLGAGGGGGGGGAAGVADHGGGHGGAGGTGGGGEVKGAASDMGGGCGAGGADEVRWWPWPGGVGGTGGAADGDCALGLLNTIKKTHKSIWWPYSHTIKLQQKI